MKHYRVILFDLDGTLTDPGVGITKSVQYALARYGITVPDRRSLYKFIGPPLKDAFMTYCGFSREQAAQALAYYREYYCEKGIFENQVYPGIPALLQQLQDAGRQLLVATSKPEIFAREILEHFQLSRYFSFVAGSDLEETRVRKADVIAYALAHENLRRDASVLMVGDREHDVLGARQLGIDCLGVLFGYGSRAELEAAGAAYLAASPEEIGRLLCGEGA